MSEIRLSVEEALEFQQLESQLQGYVAGAQAMADHVKRLKVNEMLARRKQEATDGQISN